MGGLPVTIRTLDLGADKADSTGLVLDDEDNPGARRARRAPVAAPIRSCFTIQLRAILRASRYGQVRMLVPMVATGEEMASRAPSACTNARAICAPKVTRSPSTSSSAR